MSKNLKDAATGWSNYETWCVSQWLPTDDATWDAFRDSVRRLLAEHQREPGEYGPIACWQRRCLKFQLVRDLRQVVEQLGYTDLPGIYCDLLDSALARVNWPEIVDHFLRHPFRSILPGTLRPLFEVGHVFTAPAAQAALTPDDVQTALDRHTRGEWGLLETIDRRQNLRALSTGKPVQSIYESQAGTKFWVITAADRSQTNVLLAADY